MDLSQLSGDIIAAEVILDERAYRDAWVLGSVFLAPCEFLYHGPFLRLAGLILQPTHAKEGEFRRLGKFVIEDYSKQPPELLKGYSEGLDVLTASVGMGSTPEAFSADDSLGETMSFGADDSRFQDQVIFSPLELMAIYKTALGPGGEDEAEVEAHTDEKFQAIESRMQ